MKTTMTIEIDPVTTDYVYCPHEAIYLAVDSLLRQHLFDFQHNAPEDDATVSRVISNFTSCLVSIMPADINHDVPNQFSPECDFCSEIAFDFELDPETDESPYCHS